MAKLFYWNCGHRTQQYIKKNKRICCPTCQKGFCMAVRIFCLGCGEEIGLYKANSSIKYCKECNRKRNIESQKRYQAGTGPGEIRILNHKEYIPKLRRHDCKYYDKICLSEAAFRNIELDCTGCDSYEKAFMDATSFLRMGSSLETDIGLWQAKEKPKLGCR